GVIVRAPFKGTRGRPRTPQGQGQNADKEAGPARHESDLAKRDWGSGGNWGSDSDQDLREATPSGCFFGSETTASTFASRAYRNKTRARTSASSSLRPRSTGSR